MPDQYHGRKWARGWPVNVFLSWSGEHSKQLATVLREWLALVFPEVQFWASSQDIQAGQRWRDELDRQLESTDFGVLCLVPTNLMSPWLLFEAGALSKSVAAGRVVPYCAGFQAEDVSGPLAGFQGVAADEAGTRRLLGTRLVDSGSGYNAQSDLPVHFGLGSIVKVDVEVTWPSGKGRVTSKPVSASASTRPVIIRIP